LIRIPFALLVTVASLALVLNAAAVPRRPKVVIIGPSPEQPTLVRVRDELRLLSFEVDVLIAIHPPGDLRAFGRQQGAAAVARVEEWPPEIVVWVNPELAQGPGPANGPQAAGKEIQVSDSLTEEVEPALLAVRAVELLRGALLPVPHAQNQPAATSPPTASAEADGHHDGRTAPDAAGPGSAETGPRTSVFLGPGILVSPGGVPVTPHLLAGASHRAIWRLGVDARMVIPTTAGQVSAAEGSMKLRTLFWGAAATLELTEPGSDWMVLTGLGLGAAHLWFDGQAVPPASAATGSTWAFAPFGELVARYRLHPLLSMRGDASVALLQPEPILRIAAREVASFGQPAVVLAVALEVHP